MFFILRDPRLRRSARDEGREDGRGCHEVFRILGLRSAEKLLPYPMRDSAEYIFVFVARVSTRLPYHLKYSKMDCLA